MTEIGRASCRESDDVLVGGGASRRRHTRYIGDWSSDVCSSDLSASLGNLTALRRAAFQFFQSSFCTNSHTSAESMAANVDSTKAARFDCRILKSGLGMSS